MDRRNVFFQGEYLNPVFPATALLSLRCLFLDTYLVNFRWLSSNLSVYRSLEDSITKELIDCQGVPVDIGKYRRYKNFKKIWPVFILSLETCCEFYRGNSEIAEDGDVNEPIGPGKY
jgi:hypothetical protein